MKRPEYRNPAWINFETTEYNSNWYTISPFDIIEIIEIIERDRHLAFKDVRDKKEAEEEAKVDGGQVRLNIRTQRRRSINRRNS